MTPRAGTEQRSHVTPCAHQHLRELVTAASAFAPCVEVADGWGTRLASVLDRGGRLLAAGNGGSAAQAQHLTAELVGRYRDDRPPFSAICLSAETSSLTAICNDYPAEELFRSTSGTSPNVVAAAERARRCGLTVWAFTGRHPNPLAACADEALCVEATYTATVQELHLVGLHILCAALDRELGVIPAHAGVPSQPGRRGS